MMSQLRCVWAHRKKNALTPGPPFPPADGAGLLRGFHWQVCNCMSVYDAGSRRAALGIIIILTASNLSQGQVYSDAVTTGVGPGTAPPGRVPSHGALSSWGHPGGRRARWALPVGAGTCASRPGCGAVSRLGRAGPLGNSSFHFQKQPLLNESLFQITCDYQELKNPISGYFGCSDI